MTVQERDIELEIIKLLENIGYKHTVAPSRKSHSDVVLEDKLREKVNQLNPTIPADAKEQAVREVTMIGTPDIIYNNETFHGYLTEGVTVEYQKDGNIRGDKVWLVDFNNPSNNEFLAVQQFTIIEDNKQRRPDIILFVNGLPLVVFELKRATDPQATLRTAYEQLQGYKSAIPSLFTYNALLVVSDYVEAKMGSLSASYSRFMTWKDEDKSVSPLQVETLVREVFPPEVLLDIVRSFTVFEKKDKEETQKKIAAYHQYYAVNKSLTSIQEATGENGSRKGGVIWHTQGSGKSLSMVFLTGKLVRNLNNPTIVVLTDRNDLDDQLFGTFHASRQILRQEPKQADSRKDIKKLLNVASGGIVFTTIQKFSPEDDSVEYPQLSERKNIVVIADEAHRSQYGISARQKDVKDEEGNKVGKKTTYGYAKFMRDALPNATFVGFTGTPVELDDRNTKNIFGDYVDVYDIANAIEDGATVPIHYESRLVKVRISNEGRELMDELDEGLQEEDQTRTQRAKLKWTKLEAIVGSPERLKAVAEDLIDHFEKRRKACEGKAMIVTMSRRIAARLYNAIIDIKPEWHSDDLDGGNIKVVMTSGKDDSKEIKAHHTTKEDRRRLAARLKDPKDKLRMVIVCDMWLTGFDAPCLHTLYVDKSMKGHNLMQAIARVNRVYLNKPGGLVVDYLGIATELGNALEMYSSGGGTGNPVEQQEQAVKILKEKLEIVRQIMHGFNYQEYFTAGSRDKLLIIVRAEDHILGLENGKQRYVREVTALSKALALSVPHDDAMAINEEVSLFQTIKQYLQKFNDATPAGIDVGVETAIRQIVDKAIMPEGVVDIFAAAGMAKPDISILSDEFMDQVRDMEHRNVAVHLLYRLLKDEVKIRSKLNVIQCQRLSEMLDETIRKYHNRSLQAAEIIEELVAMAKEIIAADKRGKDLGLSDYEIAFYDALSQNESAQDVMGREKLKELAVVLVDRVRKNATIDWMLKESARAQMRVIVKRLLRKFGYPPDKQKLAVELVLQQATLFADFEVGK